MDGQPSIKSWSESEKIRRPFGCSVCGVSEDLVLRRSWVKGTLAVCRRCDERYEGHWSSEP